MRELLNTKMVESVYQLKLKTAATMILLFSMALFVIPAAAADLQTSFVIGLDKAVWYTYLVEEEIMQNGITNMMAHHGVAGKA